MIGHPAPLSLMGTMKAVMKTDSIMDWIKKPYAASSPLTNITYVYTDLYVGTTSQVSSTASAPSSTTTGPPSPFHTSKPSSNASAKTKAPHSPSAPPASAGVGSWSSSSQTAHIPSTVMVQVQVQIQVQATLNPSSTPLSRAIRAHSRSPRRLSGSKSP